MTTVHRERAPVVEPGLPSRAEVEDFLFHEADLLDRWRLDEWLGLFEEGGTYRMPATDMPEGDPTTSLFLISDDWERVQARVKRLQSRNAHVENPHSRTRRIIGNVRIVPGVPGDGTGTVRVQANFAIYRIRYELTDIYVGRYDHLLAWDAGPVRAMRFRHRKTVLDLDALRPAGKVSIIL